MSPPPSKPLLEGVLSSMNDCGLTLPADFTRSLVYSAVDSPLQGSTQLWNHVENQNLAPPLELVNAPQEEKDVWTWRWHVQQAGSAIGMALPFMLVRGTLGLGGKAITSSARYLGMAKTVRLLEGPSLEALLPIANAAASGYLYDFAFTSVTKEDGDFWAARRRNALNGALTFGSQQAISAGFKLKENLQLFADKPWAVSPFKTEFSRQLLSGPATGFLNAQYGAWLHGKAYASGSDLYKSMYSFTFVGATLGAKEHAGNWLSKKAKAYFNPGESKSGQGARQADSSKAEAEAQRLAQENTARAEALAEKERLARQAQEEALAERNAAQQAADAKAQRAADKQARKNERREARTKERDEQKERERARLRQENADREAARKLTDEQLRLEASLRKQQERDRLQKEQDDRKAAQQKALKDAEDRAQESDRRQQEEAARKLGEWRAQRDARDPEKIWIECKNQLPQANAPVNADASPGIKAQDDLFKWINHKHIPTGRESSQAKAILELRAEVQNLMKTNNWELVQTNNNSLADGAGMDYILANKSDGRYFFLDATLDPKIKKSLPELRRENVVPIELDNGVLVPGFENRKLSRQPTVDTKVRFLDLLKLRMTQDSPLNLKDTPPPDLSSKLSLEQNIEHLDKFRKSLADKCQYLELEANFWNSAKAYERARDLRQQANALLEYYQDLSRVETYSRMEDIRVNDPTYRTENTCFQQNATRMASKAIADFLKTNNRLKVWDTEPGSTDLLVTDQQRRRFEYDDNNDRISFHDNDGISRYDLNNVSAILNDVFRAAFINFSPSNAGPDPYVLKRRFLSESSHDRLSVIRTILEGLAQRSTNQLLGR